jgi:hypothetical protein
MEITIQQSRPTVEGEYAITFSSPLGDAFGNWLGTPPIPGETYRVELSVEAPLVWGSDIEASPKEDYSLSSTGEKVILHALLENLEEDGLAFLRISNNLLMVSTLGSPPPVGTFVEAHIQNLTLVDINI